MDPDREHPVDPAAVVRDLKALRRGPALGASAPRIGPALRAACGGGPDAVRATLTHLLAGFAEADRTVLSTALGLNPAAGQRYYIDRVAWLASTGHRDPRTVRRHVDRVLVRVAELAVGQAVPAHPRTGPWSTRELRVAVNLDRPGAETYELRRVVADRDGLTELDLAVTIDAPRDAVRIDVFYGGTLRAQRMESSTRIGYLLALPKALGRGDLHEYAIRTFVPPVIAVKPYLVCVPRYPVALFDLRVRFPAGARPTRVRRLDSVFQRDVDDPSVPGEEVVVDEAGDAHARFADLAPGLAFGMRWECRP